MNSTPHDVNPMSENRSTHRVSKPSSYTNSTRASDNHEHHLLAESFNNMKLTPEVHNVSQAVPLHTLHDTKRLRTHSQPKGTIPYTVTNHDTIEKVAIHFNLTSSELLQINKLNSRMLFPGQILFIPEASVSEASNQQSSTVDTTDSPSSVKTVDRNNAFTVHKEPHTFNDSSSSHALPLNHPLQKDVGSVIWSIARHATARPGHAERLTSDSNTDDDSLSTDDHSKNIKISNKSSSLNRIHHVDSERLQRFIKVNVRLMTEDHESISGTLIVTPNAIMFDPDVLDPLVQEHGSGKYGLIVRMEFIAGIGLYEDLAMYEHEATYFDEEKRKTFHSISIKNYQYNRKISGLNTDDEEIRDLMSWMLDKIDKELKPSTSNDECCVIFDAASTIKRHMSMDCSDSNYNDDPFLPAPTDASLENLNDLFQPIDDYKHSLGILLDDDNSHTNTNFHQLPSQGCLVKNHVPRDQFNKRFDEIDALLRKQQETYFGPHHIEIPYYLSLKASMHVNDVPSLKPKQYKQISEKVKDNFYGKKQVNQEYWFSVPQNKTAALYEFFRRWTPERALNPLIDDDKTSSNIHQSNPNNEPSKKSFVLLPDDNSKLAEDYLKSQNSNNQIKNNESRKKPHYLSRQNTLLKDWEYNNRRTNLSMIRTVPTASTNTSCSSDEQQTPHSSSRTRRFTLHSLATRLSDSKKTFLEQIPHHQQHITRFRKRARSFLASALVEHPTDIKTSPSKERNSAPGIISVDEIYRRINSTQSHNAYENDLGFPAPTLLQPSILINEDQSKQILIELPARVHGLNWFMIFSTEIHGFSLNQLYRRCGEVDHDLPALIIVKDVEQNIFGAFTSHQLMISEGFYGTGESFLFTIHPDFRVFNWSGHNEFFVKGDLHSIGFGSGEGTFGLWLDGELYHGRTCPTKTFDNERLTLTEDFIVASIEVWTFID
ncbi:unnamed protein product [Rotaria socialis]|uniref:Oxidation resistance protein 1 n=2 Tax=Rotaria socialis TaxID=392032 RepID=A0A819U0U6_9BILA|nr:unnamed protein product [Rotaria socialis]CAF4086976.1 unnamed protein product [Rotaria socialis]CAF4173931.1 unnamed protein product [Rotaria socialis]CAF4233369.1 unnamed protein product [Rotaria socialis]